MTAEDGNGGEVCFRQVYVVCKRYGFAFRPRVGFAFFYKVKIVFFVFDDNIGVVCKR